MIDNFKSLDKNYLKDTVLDKGGGIITINYFDTTRFYPLGDPIEVGYDLFFETGSIHTVKRYNQISNFSFEANYRVNGRLLNLNYSDSRTGTSLYFDELGRLKYSYGKIDSILGYQNEYDSTGLHFGTYEIFNDPIGRFALSRCLVENGFEVNANNLHEFYYFSFIKPHVFFDYLKKEPLYAEIQSIPKEWIDSSALDFLKNKLDSKEECFDIILFKTENKPQIVTENIIAEKLLKHYFFGYFLEDVNKTELLKMLEDVK
mgnify:CR=1 FL=1